VRSLIRADLSFLRGSDWAPLCSFGIGSRRPELNEFRLKYDSVSAVLPNANTRDMCEFAFVWNPVWWLIRQRITFLVFRWRISHFMLIGKLKLFRTTMFSLCDYNKRCCLLLGIFRKAEFS
jgi:hypothetical protein